MKIFIKSIMCFTLVFALIACTETSEPGPETTFSDFTYKTDDLSVDLTQNDAVTLHLEWEKSNTENSTLAFYRVQFSGSTDFSHPAHEIVAERMGTETFLNISPETMNIIAEKSGVRQNTTNKLYWGVLASTGVSSRFISGEPKQITVTRPAGFAAIPERLYVMGDAVGVNLNGAYPFHYSDFVVDDDFSTIVGFDIVVSLKTGKLQVVNSKENIHRSFGMGASGELMEYFTGDEPDINVPADGLYHIGANFVNGTFVFSKIETVKLVNISSTAPDVEVATLNYAGDYTWTADYTSLARGRQYKFRFTETSVYSGETQNVYWGNPAESATPPSESTTDDYYYVARVNEDTKNYWRASGPADLTSKITLVMNPNDKNYYHLIQEVVQTH